VIWKSGDPVIGKSKSDLPRLPKSPNVKNPKILSDSSVTSFPPCFKGFGFGFANCQLLPVANCYLLF
jgi:hypothetical protein